MSIAIDSMKCRACGKCLDVCPGSLIVRGEDKKAVIRYPKDCWGCASCIKECPFEAISYYLGADIGGMGSQCVASQLKMSAVTASPPTRRVIRMIAAMGSV